MKDKHTEENSTVVITPRDERLLIAAVPGACVYEHLENAVRRLFPSTYSLRGRIAKLVDADFMQSRTYEVKTGGKFALYVNGLNGVRYLTQSDKHLPFRYKPDEIRTLLPSPATVAHELVVVGVVRRLRRESAQMWYELTYYDDPACRAHRKLLGLRGPVPDLLADFTFLRSPGYEYRVLLEVDMGSESPLEVADKALKQQYQTLYLCSTTERLNELWEVMSRLPQLQGMVFFSTVADFCMSPGGIFGTNFMDLAGLYVSLYP